MSEGWFGKGKKIKIDITNQETRKELNIWKKQEETVIPDIEEDNEKEDPLAKPNIISAKVKHIDELDKAVNPTNMPSAEEDGLDLEVLIKHLVPQADVTEKDELWGFETLKNEVNAMVQVKKVRNTYCGGCLSHKAHRVSQYKKGKESKAAQGRRRYDAKQKGFGGQKKPIQKRKYKITKKITLRLECSECKRRRFQVIGRCKYFKFEEKKKV